MFASLSSSQRNPHLVTSAPLKDCPAAGTSPGRAADASDYAQAAALLLTAQTALPDVRTQPAMSPALAPTTRLSSDSHSGSSASPACLRRTRSTLLLPPAAAPLTASPPRCLPDCCNAPTVLENRSARS